MVILSYLNFSFCNLRGIIPDSFAALGKLVSLDLSHNHLSGSIPVGLSRSIPLEFLDLSYNNLSGAIPTELNVLGFLRDVDFSCNRLSGEVPRSALWDTFNASAFQGNPDLCGFILRKACYPGPGSPPAPTTSILSSAPGEGPPLAVRQKLKDNGLSAGVIVGILLGCSVVIAFLAILLLFMKRKPKQLAAKEIFKFHL